MAVAWVEKKKRRRRNQSINEMETREKEKGKPLIKSEYLKHNGSCPDSDRSGSKGKSGLVTNPEIKLG